MPADPRNSAENKTGRPYCEFTLAALAAVEISVATMRDSIVHTAEILDCAQSTVKLHLKDPESPLSAAYARGHERLRETIRSRQFDIALDDSNKAQANMLQFIGKVELKQSEKSELEHSGGVTINVVGMEVESDSDLPNPA